MVARAAQRIWRVRYRENQRVRAVDLRDDQAYHVAMRRRHLSSAHDWGIVSGLALVSPASISDDFRVQPGVAVDIYGRTLALSQPLSILPDELSGFADGDTVTRLLLVAAGPVTAVPLLLFAAGARRIRFSTLGLLQYLAPSLQLVLGVWLYHEPFAARAPGYALIWLALAVFSLEGVVQGWRRRAAA